MKKNYPFKTDRNGYGPSLWPTDCCAICGRSDRALHRHEPFHGSYRQKSKAFGCWTMICYGCHERLHQHDAALDLKLKQAMQVLAMDHYGWDTQDFIREFGKNYLED